MEKCLQSTEFLREKPFIQLPKSINSMDMSSDAKLLYANLADLLKISELNNHRDERGLYVFCSLEYIQQVLGCGEGKATKTLKELEEKKLIAKKRMGQGKSNRYYMFAPPESKQADSEVLKMVENLPEMKVQNPENRGSGIENLKIDCSRTFDFEDLESILSRNLFP